MKLICGPMATLSHPAFRRLVGKFGGCDEYFTEMINAGTLLTGGPFEKYYLDPSPFPERTVRQLIGKSGELIVRAAGELARLPGLGVDINMGCSAPDIYRYGSGIAWMMRPLPETARMVSAVRNELERRGTEGAGRKRLSVKIRLGDEDFSAAGFVEFCSMLADSGAELVTVHPRTRKEKLVRPPRWEFCGMAAEVLGKKGVPVYINGNVRDEASARAAMAAAPGCAGIMISREAARSPWIFMQLSSALDGNVRSPEPPVMRDGCVDLMELALDFISDVEMCQPPEFWRTRLQRFFSYYCDNFKFSHYARTSLLNAADNDDLRARLVDFFSRCPDERMRRIRFPCGKDENH